MSLRNLFRRTRPAAAEVNPFRLKVSREQSGGFGKGPHLVHLLDRVYNEERPYSALDYCVAVLEEALAQGRPEIFLCGSRACSSRPGPSPRCWMRPASESRWTGVGVVSRLRLHRTPLAECEVRGPLSPGLPERADLGGRAAGLLPVLQRAASTSGVGLPHTGGGPPRSRYAGSVAPGQDVNERKPFASFSSLVV